MRLAWQSNAWFHHSGYGKMTALFVPRINSMDEHEIVAVSAPYSFGQSVLAWDDIPVLGAARDMYGNDVLPQHHEYFSADLTVILADPFNLRKCALALREISTATWFPVDCSPAGAGDVAFLRDSETIPIAMSEFGRRMLENEGCAPLYVPHGVDTGLYRPGDPVPYRDTVPGMTGDSFVIGIVAMNRDKDRKGFQEQLLAFASFHARHPDSFLAVHSAPGGGVNLPALAARLGITGAVAFPDSYSYDLGLISEEQLATFYQGLDILSMTSYGEGFGLPLLEAQACGIPVVTTDASATSELCGAGWLVSGTPFWTDGHQAWWTRPDASDIVNAYETAFQARENGTLPKKPARDFALQYDADRVFNLYWKPALGALQDRLQIP